MTRLLTALTLLVALTTVGCARHHVTARDQGRVDGDKSITSDSDEEWQVRREPAR